MFKNSGKSKTPATSWGKMGHEQRAGNSSGGGQGPKTHSGSTGGPKVGPR